MSEILKVKTGITPELMEGVFEFADVPYNLRNQSKPSCSIPCTKRYGIETRSSIGPKLWDKVPTVPAFFNFVFSFNFEHESKQSNFIVSCH